MYLKTDPKGSIQKFLEAELFGISQSKSKKKKGIDKIDNSENQVNSEFSIDFEDLLSLSYFSRYSSLDLAIFSVFVFMVEVSIFAGIFSFELNYFVFFILLFYNLLVAILLRFIVYKEIKNFNEFIRWVVMVAPFGVMLPWILILAMFTFVIISVVVIIIAFVVIIIALATLIRR